MHSSAVKFTYGESSEVIFYADEVNDIVWDRAQEYQIHHKQATAPDVKYVGSVVDGLQIVFDIVNSDTEDKIDTIMAAGVELTCYYAMLNDAAANVKVIPLIDGTEEMWVYGHEASSRTKTLTFLQSGT